jgi:hypothetical protein
MDKPISQTPDHPNHEFFKTDKELSVRNFENAINDPKSDTSYVGSMSDGYACILIPENTYSSILYDTISFPPPSPHTQEISAEQIATNITNQRMGIAQRIIEAELNPVGIANMTTPDHKTISLGHADTCEGQQKYKK